MIELSGNALVTGAASGIGRATAIAYAAAGCAGIALCDVAQAGLDETAAACRAASPHPDTFRLTSQIVDVSDEKAVFEWTEKVKEELGRIDYAANLAGILGPWPPQKFADQSLETFDKVHSVNAHGLLACTQAQIKVMLTQDRVGGLPGREWTERGSIVNMASIAGWTAFPGFSPYSVSKFTAIGITKNAAESHTGDGIRINACCPGFVDTPLIHASVPDRVIKAWREGSYMKRFGQPEEVASVILFLSSPHASFVNGAAWEIHGGHR